MRWRPRRVMVPSAGRRRRISDLVRTGSGRIGSDRAGVGPAAAAGSGAASDAPVGWGLVLWSRYFVPCAGDGPVSVMITRRDWTAWIKQAAEGDKEADGGRRRRINRRHAEGDHRAADRQLQGGRGARAGEPLRRGRREHQPDLSQPRGG